jgi:rubredoxin
VVKAPPAQKIPPNVCPKCSGTLIKDLDDDRHCLQCGYIVYARPPKNVVRTRPRRRPSHGGLYL